MSKVTQKQIQDWKKQYGEVYVLEVDGKKGYIRHPDRQTLSFAIAEAVRNPLGSTDIILENCWLGGDEELLTNDKYYLGISKALDNLIEIADVRLKKL